MRLAQLQVLNYKVIDDSGPVTLDPNVTAFVGRNESGKTGILRALWKSRNVAGVEFDKQLDYPRSRFTKERKGTQPVTALEFALLKDEQDELLKLFPFKVEPAPTKVTLHTQYVGEDDTETRVAFEDHVESRCALNSARVRDAVTLLGDALSSFVGVGDKTVADAVDAALASLDPARAAWDKTNADALVTFKATIDKWVSAAAERAGLAAGERAAIDALVAEAKGGDPAAKARDWATKRMPAFIYFDDYGQLRTKIHLPTYLRLVKEKQPAADVRTQRALFKWSGIDPQEILDLGKPRADPETVDDVQRRLEKRRILLESASRQLTGEWSDWWLPDRQHVLHITADGEYLVLNVSDSKDPHLIPFEERSKGFQWFFSFYLIFLVESEDAHQGAILLLDEPGLHLHPTMQSRLVGLFSRIAKANQVLYSTHLPFLVDGDHLDRVRTVFRSDAHPPKTIVSTDARAGGDRDTVFPLQAAIGYSIAQTLFIGKRSVIVEGITDYIILRWLDAQLGVLKRPRFHEETVLVPGGVTSKLMPLASLMFASTGVEGKRMLVLLDSDNEGRQFAKRIDADLFATGSRVLMLGAPLARTDATIEDVPSRGEYLAAVQAALGRAPVLSTDEEAEPMIVTALVRHFQRMGWGAFGKDEKAQVAFKLVEMWTAKPDAVAAETLENASKVLLAINGRFNS